MNRVKLIQFRRIMPNPIKILDKLFFSEPLIEKCSTFEAKMILVSHALGIGYFYDKRGNQRTRNFLIRYHIGCAFLVWSSSAFYLCNLQVYDARTVTFGIVPIITSTIKFLIISAGSHLPDAFEKLVTFFVDDDYNRSNFTTPSEKANKSCINVKKWVILTMGFSLSSYFSANAIFDLESETKISRFTYRPHLMKYFPMWCPFENLWAKKMVLLFQDAILLPEISVFFFSTFMTFISIITLHNEFNVMFAKLKLFSERAFERIGIFDKQMDEAMQISNERLRSSIVEGLDEGRKNTVEMFYRDFIRCVEHYQHLQRAQLSLKNILDYCCSIQYCYLLAIMIGFGFTGIEALLNLDREFEFIITMLIWFFASGIAWYLFCIVGDLFSREHDLFGDEVYSMPWYYFSPAQRKTVLTLLSTIQQPIHLRALKLVIVKKDAFPDFLNTVYSYLQTMRTLQNVKHRNT